MNVLIAGSRGFDDWRRLCETMAIYKRDHRIKRIISGGAKGADKLGERYARRYHIPLLRIKPEWQKYGRGAGLLRNQELVDAADHVFCFWDGKSKGTRDTMRKTKEAGKSIDIILY